MLYVFVLKRPTVFLSIKKRTSKIYEWEQNGSPNILSIDSKKKCNSFVPYFECKHQLVFLLFF